jgi:predicted DNA-binding ribbon-helix-helix protein
MHRTQIYFEEAFFEELKKQAKQANTSLSGYIRDVLAKDLAKAKKQNDNADFSEFAGLWQDRDISQASLRDKAWK